MKKTVIINRKIYGKVVSTFAGESKYQGQCSKEGINYFDHPKENQIETEEDFFINEDGVEYTVWGRRNLLERPITFEEFKEIADEYFNRTSPEEVLREFEAMGYKVDFKDIATFPYPESNNTIIYCA